GNSLTLLIESATVLVKYIIPLRGGGKRSATLHTVCTSTTPGTALIAPAICGDTRNEPGRRISASVSRSSIITSVTSPSDRSGTGKLLPKFARIGSRRPLDASRRFAIDSSGL